MNGGEDALGEIGEGAGELLVNGLAVGGEALGGIGGSGGAQVGDEIGEGFVDFVADAGDDRQATSGDGAHEEFVIKDSEVIGAAATSQDNDGVEVSALIEEVEGGDDLVDGGEALDLGVDGEDLEAAPAIVDDFEEVAVTSGGGGGDDAEARGVGGERTFAGGIKKTFGGEFALEERGACEVYLGSPAEIVATARARVRRSSDASELLFSDTLESLPVLERLSAAADASDLREQAALLGLEMSERTAHRIVSGQICPLRSVLSTIMRSDDTSSKQPHEIDLLRDRRSLRVSKPDLEEFSRVMERSFDLLAERYYLSLSSAPKVSVGRGRITVTFDLEESD